MSSAWSFVRSAKILDAFSFLPKSNWKIAKKNEKDLGDTNTIPFLRMNKFQNETFFAASRLVVCTIYFAFLDNLSVQIIKGKQPKWTNFSRTKLN